MKRCSGALQGAGVRLVFGSHFSGIPESLGPGGNVLSFLMGRTGIMSDLKREPAGANTGAMSGSLHFLRPFLPLYGALYFPCLAGNFLRTDDRRLL